MINDNLYKTDILTDALNYSEPNFRQLTSIQDIDIVMISISMHVIKMLEIISLLQLTFFPNIPSSMNYIYQVVHRGQVSVTQRKINFTREKSKEQLQ